jgi:hypothetical protein
MAPGFSLCVRHKTKLQHVAPAPLCIPRDRGPSRWERPAIVAWAGLTPCYSFNSDNRASHAAALSNVRRWPPSWIFSKTA